MIMQSAANSFPSMNVTGSVGQKGHRFPRLVSTGPGAPTPPVAPRSFAPASLRASVGRRSMRALLVVTAIASVGFGITRTWTKPDWLGFPALRYGQPSAVLVPPPRVVAPPAPVPGAGAGAALPTRQGKTARTASKLPEPAIQVLVPRGAPEPARDVVSAALFGSHSWSPPPPPPIVVAPQPPPKPTAPALPFAYLGKMFDTGVWEAYLSRGDETFVVREHGVIDANYRVETIAPPTMTIVYLPLMQTQTLSIGDQ